MPVVIAFVSQKGGVGKSTLARALAVAAAGAGCKVKLVDLDPLQRTLVLWDKARRRNNVVPAITVEAVDNFAKAIAAAERDTLLILDTPGQVSRQTKKSRSAPTLSCNPRGPRKMTCIRQCWCFKLWRTWVSRRSA